MLVLSVCFEVRAQETEELLFLEIPSVLVASRMEEKVTEAPGIVKVWTQEEIRRMGIYTLDELAQLTVGYGIEEADGLHGFEVRGLHGNAFDNQKVLLMINGMPINIARNLRAWIGEELPLYFVERVEFLKGPSSALYGNGAVLGVVNIVTSPQESENILESKISVGQPHEQKRFMGHCLMKKKNMSGDICFGFYGKNNSEEIYGENNVVRDSKKPQNLLATFDCTQDSPLNGLKFGVFSISQRGGLGTGWIGTTHKIDDYTFETLQPFLMYNKKLTNKLTLDTKLLFQRNDDIGLFYAGGQDAIEFGLIDHAYMGDIGLIYISSDKFNIIGGIAYDRRWHTNENSHFYIFSSGTIIQGGDYYFNSSKSCIITSAYLQLQNEFPILQGLRSTLGVRYDEGNNLIEPGNSFSKTSPRLGLVQRVNDCFNVKLLYGTAMRSLGLKEGIDNTMYADEYKRQTGLPITFTAKPETIETVEASAVYHTNRFQTSITYFDNTMKNPIRAYNVPVGTSTAFVVPYLNVAKEHKSSGVELDFDMGIPKGKFFINAAIQEGKDSDGKEIPNVPKTKFNAGLLYHLPVDLDVSLIVKNAGYTRRGTTTDASVLSKLGDRVGAHTVVDINCIKKINDDVRLELKVNNLFDKDWYYPQLSDTLPFDHPQSGRTVLCSMDVRF